MTLTLRQSSIGDFLMCGKRYEFERVKNMPSRTNMSAMLGTVVHTAIARTIQEAAPKDIRVLWQEAIEFETRDLNEDVSLDSAVKTSQEKYADWLVWWNKQDILPATVEHSFTLPFCEGITLHGTWDLGTKQGNLFDWKTAKRKWTPAKAAAKIQAPLYAWAHEQITGHLPETFTFVVMAPASKTDSSTVQELTVRITPAKILAMKQSVEQVARAINAGVFVPNPGDWWCSSKWCPHYSYCEQGAAAQS